MHHVPAMLITWLLNANTTTTLPSVMYTPSICDVELTYCCLLLAGTNIPEVDSVLTTSEVQQLIEQQSVSFPDLPRSSVDSLLGPTACGEQLHGVHGGSGMPSFLPDQPGGSLRGTCCRVWCLLLDRPLMHYLAQVT